MSTPLVSIGTPTFNRAARLERSARSALGQTCADIELIVSDNASSDTTESVGRALAESDRRVRYFRQPTNLGPIPNFEFVRRQARGRFFMWLSDDDWLDAGYVAACVAALEADAGCALAAGLPRYYEHDRFVTHGIPLELADGSAWRRILRHYYTVVCCGAFYGLMRSEHARLVPLHNVVGADWLFVGSLAFLGRVRNLPDVHIHRQLTGVSRTAAGNARAVGASGFHGRNPHLSVGISAVRDIMSSPVYRTVGPVRRAALAAAAFATLSLTRSRPAKWLFRARRKIFGPLRRSGGRVPQRLGENRPV